MQKITRWIVVAAASLCSVGAMAQSCDTTNYDAAFSSWSQKYYGAPTPFPGFTGGYINGVNWSGDFQKGNYFDLSGSSYTHVLGVVVKFGKANSTKAANLSKNVYYKIYDDNGGKPGNLLATAQNTLQDIKDDVAAGRTTNINFSSAVALPSSKKFYMTVDISEFTWSLGGSTRDSLYIVSSADDELGANTAWEYENDSTWVAFPDNWDNPDNSSSTLDVSLWIFPYVSTTAGGCGLLPVKLISFDAERKNADATISWKVSDELNMQGYAVERAGSNGVFRQIAFITAHNNAKNESYSYTDKNVFANPGYAQYRLKQVDADGTVTYSKIISLQNNSVFNEVIIPNPVRGNIQLNINSAVAGKINVQVYDIAGRQVANTSATEIITGGQTIIIPGTDRLKAGTYMVKINSGGETKTLKVIKQ